MFANLKALGTALNGARTAFNAPPPVKQKVIGPAIGGQFRPYRDALQISQTAIRGRDLAAADQALTSISTAFRHRPSFTGVIQAIATGRKAKKAINAEHAARMITAGENVGAALFKLFGK